MLSGMFSSIVSRFSILCSVGDGGTCPVLWSFKKLMSPFVFNFPSFSWFKYCCSTFERLNCSSNEKDKY